MSNAQKTHHDGGVVSMFGLRPSILKFQTALDALHPFIESINRGLLPVHIVLSAQRVGPRSYDGGFKAVQPGVNFGQFMFHAVLPSP
jgi:hypothetical protein